MRIWTTLPASCETCMQIKKKQLEADMEQWTGSKLGKKYIKALLQNSRLDEAHLGFKIAKRNINNLRYADDTTHGRKQRGIKKPLDESEKRKVKKLA